MLKLMLQLRNNYLINNSLQITSCYDLLTLLYKYNLIKLNHLQRRIIYDLSNVPKFCSLSTSHTRSTLSFKYLNSYTTSLCLLFS